MQITGQAGQNMRPVRACAVAVALRERTVWCLRCARADPGQRCSGGSSVTLQRFTAPAYHHSAGRQPAPEAFPVMVMREV
jgi:hypothetical protein